MGFINPAPKCELIEFSHFDSKEGRAISSKQIEDFSSLLSAEKDDGVDLEPSELKMREEARLKYRYAWIVEACKLIEEQTLNFKEKHPLLTLNPPTLALKGKLEAAAATIAGMGDLTTAQLQESSSDFSGLFRQITSRSEAYGTRLKQAQDLLELNDFITEKAKDPSGIKPYDYITKDSQISALAWKLKRQVCLDLKDLLGPNFDFLLDLDNLQDRLDALIKTPQYRLWLHESTVLEALGLQSLGIQSLAAPWEKLENMSSEDWLKVEELSKELCFVRMPPDYIYRLGDYDAICLDRANVLYEIPRIALTFRTWRSHLEAMPSFSLTSEQRQTFIRLHKDGGYETLEDILNTVEALDF